MFFVVSTIVSIMFLMRPSATAGRDCLPANKSHRTRDCKSRLNAAREVAMKTKSTASLPLCWTCAVDDGVVATRFTSQVPHRALVIPNARAVMCDDFTRVCSCWTYYICMLIYAAWRFSSSLMTTHTRRRRYRRHTQWFVSFTLANCIHNLSQSHVRSTTRSFNLACGGVWWIDQAA